MEKTEHKYTEQQVSHTQVHDKGCIGCIRHKKDIMITFIETEDGKAAHDVFMTMRQAEILIDQLQKIVNTTSATYE